MDLKNAFELYVEFCTLQNYSRDTLRYYNEKAHHFEKHLPVTLEELTESCLNNYIQKQLLAGNKASTINCRLRALRAVLRRAVAEGCYHKAIKIKMLKEDMKEDKSYTDEEVQKLLKRPKKPTFVEFRNWVIVNVLLGTGIRLKSLLTLKVKSFDRSSCLLRLEHTKNRKNLTLPIGEMLSEILIEYLDVREGEPEDFMFCNQWGEELLSSTLQTAIQRYHQKRGVKGTSIHAYRHTFAKLAIKGGVDAFKLQRMLGHSDIGTTQNYVHLYAEDLREDIQSFSPVEKQVKRRKIKM